MLQSKFLGKAFYVAARFLGKALYAALQLLGRFVCFEHSCHELYDDEPERQRIRHCEGWMDSCQVEEYWHAAHCCRVQVMAESADHCIRELLMHCQAPRAVPVLLHALRTDKNARIRSGVASYFAQVGPASPVLLPCPRLMAV